MGVTLFECNLQSSGLMEKLLEPKFIYLVNSDEQKLIVLRSVTQWLLEFEKFINF
jgi:hypothetical protein